MKRSSALIALVALMCLLLAGCAVFRSHGGEGAGKGSATAAGVNLSPAGSPEGNAATNQSTVIITSSGPITTTTEGGKVTTIAGGGQGGSDTDFGGTGAGAGGSAAKGGHGPLFYVYMVFAAAVVLWVLWALWRGFHRDRPQVRVRYRRPRRAA